MFNSLIRDFEEDPFFSDPFRAHNERMHQMMGFSDSFGHGVMPSITDGRNSGRRGEGQQSTSLAPRSEHRDMDFFRNPFAMMAGMRNRMEDMHRNVGNMSTDSNTHAFSSSSVMTYSKVGDEPAKVFQASSQMRHAPGGVKETRQTVKDSESGVEKMSIGHHIKDRGHVIEKKNNKKTGEREFNQDFQNMDETEAQAFDEEWQHKVSKFRPAGALAHLEAPKARAVHRTAITGPELTQRKKTAKPAEGGKKSHFSELNIESSSIKK